MNAKTLFKPRQSRFTAADMTTASADGFRAGQAADNELLQQCRTLIKQLSNFNTSSPGMALVTREMLSALDERLS